MKRLFPLFLLFLALGAHAYSGQELLADCRAAEALYQEKKAENPYQSLQGARCIAYVTGFADGYGVGDYLAGQVGVQLNAFCLPKGDDLQYRLVRAVVTHLERQPPNASAPGRTLVAGALSKAFPCGQ
ncbi:MAG TPA: Rap1a/Tai family immunity protein [Rhodocyclaceae bacterium]|nr:Rap1a/Tai family immunity protein [Rhodocyclaceae bacterium]